MTGRPPMPPAWRVKARLAAWSGFCALSIGAGLGALVVGGQKGASAATLFAVAALCSCASIAIELLAPRRVDDSGSPAVPGDELG
jgi:hypothetical protein